MDPEPPAEHDPVLWERLAEHIANPETCAAAQAILERADPRLVALLLPQVPGGPIPDRTGEDVRVDLLDANVQLLGSHLVGWIRGIGVAENGAWLAVDVGGGPALDLEFGFGNAWSRESVIDGGQAKNAMARDVMPTMAGDTVSFDVDLSESSRFEPGHSGVAVALVKSFDGTLHDAGPGGILGEPSMESLDVLAAIAGSIIANEVQAKSEPEPSGQQAPQAQSPESPAPLNDADLAVALAITFGTLRSIVADEVVGLVDADAVAWYDYGTELDAWLETQGATWSFSQLDAMGKLAWAWPAAQAVSYGAFPLAAQATRLDAARYRFSVPNVATLAAYRDRAPLRGSAPATASAIDGEIWAKLRYRASDDLMTALCANDELDRTTCRSWNTARIAGHDLGTAAGLRIAENDGVSAGFQLGVLKQEGQFVGDCATATTLAITSMQAVGIPAIAMGWSGSDLTTPTHDVPLWYNGERFVGTQRGPAKQWAKEQAFVYVTLPGVHPENAFALASEPNGWSRGGSIAGGWTSYREVQTILREGLPSDVFETWIRVQSAGGWPTW